MYAQHDTAETLALSPTNTRAEFEEGFWCITGCLEIKTTVEPVTADLTGSRTLAPFTKSKDPQL